MRPLIERLRARCVSRGPGADIFGERTAAMMLEAADRVEKLEQRVATLEAALVPFADYADTWPATNAPFRIDGKRYTDDYDFGARFRHGDGKEQRMKLGHYREARRLLGRVAARSDEDEGEESEHP